MAKATVKKVSNVASAPQVDGAATGKLKSKELNARATLSTEAWAQAAECLRVLAHPTRLQMVQKLLEGKFTVGEIATHCDVASNVASEHLRLMQRCGFLESSKESRCVYYQVSEPHLADIMNCIESRFRNS